MLEVISDIVELIKVSIFKPEATRLNLSKFGVNVFFNQPNLGTLKEQAKDIDSMGINKVRVLFHWGENTQPKEDSPINFSFYDDIIKSLPKNFHALVVITGCPSWNKISKEPTKKYLNFIKTLAVRYKDDPRVWGFQVHNEPNSSMFEDNAPYEFHDPKKYFEFLKAAYATIKSVKSDYMVTNAATTSIIQGFPNTIKYNNILLDLGVLDYVDAYSFHYYGNDYLNFYRPGGAYRTLKRIKHKFLICTEIGCDEPEKHRAYALQKIAYLSKKLPNIMCFMWYQYDGGGTTTTYGLRPGNSTLYEYLKSG